MSSMSMLKKRGLGVHFGVPFSVSGVCEKQP